MTFKAEIEAPPGYVLRRLPKKFNPLSIYSGTYDIDSKNISTGGKLWFIGVQAATDFFSPAQAAIRTTPSGKNYIGFIEIPPGQEVTISHPPVTLRLTSLPPGNQNRP